MKALILYSSKHGFTEKCARLLADRLPGSELASLDKGPSVSLDGFDTVIVGSSVYVGTIRKPASQFCKDNLDKLKSKKLGLFICCGFEDKVDVQLKAGFPEELLKAAKATAHFGYNFADLGFMDNMISKVVKAPVGTTKIKDGEIAAFAKSMGA